MVSRCRSRNLASVSFVEFFTEVEKLIAAANEDDRLMMVRTPSNIDVPQLFLDIDRTKAKLLGIDLTTLFETLQVQLGSLYINNFNKFGRVYQVQAQAEGWARSESDDIGRLYVRTSDGHPVPLSSLASVKMITGPDFIPHYNLYETVSIIGSPNVFNGTSSSQAVKAMDELAESVLPEDYGYEWTGTTYQELAAGNLTPYIFALGLIVVFLLLAAQYESWILPIMIMLTVPLAVLGAIVALLIMKKPLDIYGQIGLVMLIGLAAKNAILIVEFAKELRMQGKDIVESAVGAAKLRLRPDPDDSVQFHPRSGSAGFSERGGCCQSTVDRNRRIRRHAHVDDPEPGHRSRLLCDLRGSP